MEIETVNFPKYHSGIRILNEYIIENYEVLSKSESKILLYYLSTFAMRGIRILSAEKLNKILSQERNYLEKNHSNINLSTILDNVTLIGVNENFRFKINLNDYLKGREEELKAVRNQTLYRCLIRCSSSKMEQKIRYIITKFITDETILRLNEEKFTIKFNMITALCKIEKMELNLSISNIIKKLILSSRAEYDKMTTYEINYFAESILSWDDENEKRKTLIEICDNFVILINKREPTLNSVVILKLIEILAKVRLEHVISKEHIMVMLDYYFENDKVRNQGFMKIFSIFKMIKFTDAKYIEKCFDIVIEDIIFFPNDNHLIDFKNISKNNLPNKFIEKIREKLEKRFNQIINDKEINNFISIFPKICLFECNQELIQKAVNRFVELIKQDYVGINNYGENYINFTQKFKNDNQLDKPDIIAEEFLNHIERLEKRKIFITTELKFKLYLFLNELRISKNNKELEKRLREKLQNISEDEKFLNVFLRYYVNFTNKTFNEDLYITNLGFSRFLNLMQKLSKKEDFIRKGELMIYDLLIISTNIINLNNKFLINSRKIDNNLIHALLRIIELFIQADEKYLPFVSAPRLSYCIKLLNTIEFESPFLEKISIKTLKTIQFIKNNLSSDMTTLLEKVFVGRISDDKIEIFKKIFVDENISFSRFKNSNLFVDRIFMLYIKMNKIDNKNLITDENLIKIKNVFLNDLDTYKLSPLQKLTVLFSITQSHRLLIQPNEINEFIHIIKKLLENTPLRRIVNYPKIFPIYNKKVYLTKLIYKEISNKYIKEPANKVIAIRLLEKYCSIKWPEIEFYNKFIKDYSEVSELFDSNDSSNLIVTMSKNNFNHFEIIENALGNIKIKDVEKYNDIEMFSLLFAIKNLGVYKNSKIAKEVIHMILLNENMEQALKKIIDVTKIIEFLWEAYILHKNGYEVTRLVINK
jgi:hypothetical protein